MKPVSHYPVANIRISEQTTKFYLSFFKLGMPNSTRFPYPHLYITSTITHLQLIRPGLTKIQTKTII